jgi:hypothetical protein
MFLYSTVKRHGDPSSRSVGATPRCKPTAPPGRKQTVDPLDQWDCVLEWGCSASSVFPPSTLTAGFNGSLCCEEEEYLQGAEWNWGRNGKGGWWLRSSGDRKLRGPIVASDQTSCQGQQCSETLLTGEPSSIVSVGGIPGTQTATPLGRKQRLTHWTSETVYWSEAQGLYSTIVYTIWSVTP